MCSHYDFNYVKTLSPKHIIGLLNKAIEEQEKQKAWGMWLAKFPNMNKKTFVPFSDFYKKATMPQKISQRPAEEILKEAEQIREQLGR